MIGEWVVVGQQQQDFEPFPVLTWRESNVAAKDEQRREAQMVIRKERHQYEQKRRVRTVAKEKKKEKEKTKRKEKLEGQLK